MPARKLFDVYVGQIDVKEGYRWFASIEENEKSLVSVWGATEQEAIKNLRDVILAGMEAWTAKRVKEYAAERKRKERNAKRRQARQLEKETA